MKRQAKAFDEQDVVSRYWRRVYAWTKRAGNTSKVKRRMRRRERREGKSEARDASSTGRAGDF